MKVRNVFVDTFGFDLELSGGLGTGHRVGGDALIHPGITGHQPKDLQGGPANNLRLFRWLEMNRMQ